MNPAPVKFPPPSPHLGYLDGFRALAAMYVVLYHALLQVNFRPHPPVPWVRNILQFFFFGHFAVDAFIVLSGFCLLLPVIRAGGVLRGGAVAFLQRRAWRIVPPYYAALALSLLLIRGCIGQKTGTHWDVSLPVTGKSIVTHLCLVQDVLGDEASINHVFWSISVEWRIYFLFPLLLLGWARLGPVLAAALAVAASYGLFQLCGSLLGNPLAAHYIGLFALGMLGASVAHPTDRATRWLGRLPWTLVTAGLTLGVALAFFPGWWNGPRLHVYAVDYLVGGWSASLLVAVTRGEGGWLARGLGCRPLALVGTFAYSIYLIHAPLLQVLWQYVFTPLHARPLLLFAALALAGVPAILGASYVFFLLCERPFLRRPQPNLPAGPGLPAPAASGVLQPAP